MALQKTSLNPPGKSTASDKYISVTQAAKLLGVGEQTVRRWIYQGKLRARLTAQGRYLFTEKKLRRWAKNHHIMIGKPQAKSTEDPTTEVPLLMDALKRGNVFFNIDGTDIASVLKEAVSRVPLPQGVDRAELLDAIVEREAMASTGVGMGVAIPHPRQPLGKSSFEPRITTCFLRNEIDFHAVDGRPVFALFIMLNASPAQHLQMLSELSYYLRDDAFIALMKKCKSAGGFYEKFEVKKRRA